MSATTSGRVGIETVPLASPVQTLEGIAGRPVSNTRRALRRFFVTSTLSRDYPMILALVLLVAVVWGITYLFTDILYTLLDPRIRLR